MGKAVGGNAVIERRIASGHGLSATDGHALAGFVDAEGHFAINANNRGAAWSCSFSIAVRLDDADVLTDLCRVTGLGRVTTKPARRGSRPQAEWRVASKRECLEVMRALRRFPLRARKRRDFEIWADAVGRWAAIPYDARADRAFHAKMARDAGAIRDVRRYVKSPPPALDGPARDVLADLGGFFSGEGSFSLNALQPRAIVKVRRDDRAILDLFAAHTGLGKVREHAGYGNDNPSVTWLICATDDMDAAVRLFEAAELRGRKRREFEVWREAAQERAFARLAGRRWDRVHVQRVADDLAALRRYRAPADVIRALGPHAEAGAAREAYVDVLRACAGELSGREAHLYCVRARCTRSGRRAARSRSRSGRGRTRWRPLDSLADALERSREGGRSMAIFGPTARE
jgi:hypothetical protein